MADNALATARATESAVHSGATLGPRHGVPVGLKDLYCTKGVKTTGGSKILADWVPEEDATGVARLAGAGAIALGKLNLHEFTVPSGSLSGEHGRLCHEDGGSEWGDRYRRASMLTILFGGPSRSGSAGPPTPCSGGPRASGTVGCRREGRRTIT